MRHALPPQIGPGRDHGMKISRMPWVAQLTWNRPPPPVWSVPKSTSPMSGCVAAVPGVRSEITKSRAGPNVDADHEGDYALNWTTPRPTVSHVTVPSVVEPPMTVD